VTSIPAIITPRLIRSIACQYFTPNRYASRLPLHAPDPGRGIDTNIIMNALPYFANFFECLLRVLSKRNVKNRSISLECFLRRFAIGSSSFRMKNAGIRFPSVPIINAWGGLKPNPMPNGMPSLSSSPGSIEVKNVAISGVVRFSSMVGL